MRIIVTAISIILLTSNVYATPSVTSATQSISHGGSITISGTDFGTKSPVKPLMWDDCESGTADVAPNSTANDDSQVGYSQVLPPASREGDTISEPYQTMYRETGYDPVSTEVAGPHSRGSMYIVGGHESVANDGARDVSLTVATPSAAADRWYMQFYYRVDPGWAECGVQPNHKITCVQEGTAVYASGSNNYYYNDFGGGITPCADSSIVNMKVMPRSPAMGGNDTDPTPDTSPPWDVWGDADGDNPRLDWVQMRMEIAQDTGYSYLYINETLVWGGSGNPDFFTGSGSYDFGFSGIRSISAGGFHATDNAEGYPDKQSGTDFRYFDDIYIDSTLSRVVFANNATYASATIIEPQPPTAWSTTEITATVNLGALTGSTVYAFVFDADGAVNATGYAVTIGSVNSKGITCSGCQLQ